MLIPSEKKQRRLSEDILGDNLEAEEAPFSFALQHGGEDLRPAPLVFVPDLVTFVLQYLEQNQRYRYIHPCTYTIWENITYSPGLKDLLGMEQ